MYVNRITEWKPCNRPLRHLLPFSVSQHNKQTQRKMLQNKASPSLVSGAQAVSVEEDRGSGACPSSAPPE